MDTKLTLDMPPIAVLTPTIARRILQEEVGKGVTRLVERIATLARDNAPVDRGTLRGSIFTRVTPEQGRKLITGIVATGREAPYAADVEHGTAPHWISDIDALKGWARRKLGDEHRAHAVRQAIALRGTRPQPYMAPAAATVLPQVMPIMQAAVTSAVRRLEQTG